MPEVVTGNMYTWYYLNCKSGTETNPIEYVSKHNVCVLAKIFIDLFSRQSQLELSFYKLVLDFSTPRCFSLRSSRAERLCLLLGALFHTKNSLLLLRKVF